MVCSIIIVIFSSIYIPDEISKYLAKNKIYAMAMAGDTMEIINYDSVN
ncbi:MAG: hypothetical protein KAT05_08785 [Spirochaetes bacterium]|nr:hypothetical protein [Spirochaetota bacterium]